MSAPKCATIDPTVELVHREFERDKLYGEIVTKYEAGRVVIVRRTESIKPAEQRTSRDED
jgi:hypothetical protein